MRTLFAWICLLGVTLPTLAQQPLFDFRKEFSLGSFTGIKPGTRYIMDQGRGSMSSLPKLFSIKQTAKGPRPGVRVPSEPLRKMAFRLVKFVAYKDDDSGRDEVIAIMDSPKGQYCFLQFYSMDKLVTNQFQKSLPYFINLDEFDRAKKLLEGKAIYPAIHYVAQGKKPEADEDYV